jgi:hypothetical protein
MQDIAIHIGLDRIEVVGISERGAFHSVYLLKQGERRSAGRPQHAFDCLKWKLLDQWQCARADRPPSAPRKAGPHFT